MTNGDLQVTFRILGTTQLNGTTKFVGDVLTNTFVLYEDPDLQQKQTEVHLHPTQGLSGTWVDADSVYFKVQALTANDVQVPTANNIGYINNVTRNVYAGLINGTTAEITIAISIVESNWS